MRRKISKYWWSVGAAIWLVAVGWVGSSCYAEQRRPLPKFEEVEEIVLRHFSILPDYRPGDIIARSEVEPLFPQLRRMGWYVTDRNTILKKVPPDGDFLVHQLRTKQGRKFMRDVASTPGAYDQLDRIRWLPKGQRTVHELIKNGGGGKVINYFTTTEDGSRMGRMMAKKPRSANFNKPTGRIYTAEMLLDHLKKSYAAETKRVSEK